MLKKQSDIFIRPVAKHKRGGEVSQIFELFIIWLRIDYFIFSIGPMHFPELIPVKVTVFLLLIPQVIHYDDT